METYKMGDLIKTKRGDKAVIIDILEDNEKAIVFNLSKMHPDKINIKDIKEKVVDPDCKIVIEKVQIKNDEDSETDTKEEIKEAQETKEELLDTLKTQNNFLRDLISSVIRKITE